MPVLNLILTALKYQVQAALVLYDRTWIQWVMEQIDGEWIVRMLEWQHIILVWQ